MADWVCADCPHLGEYDRKLSRLIDPTLDGYMVHDHVWRLATDKDVQEGNKRAYFLHLDCLERRIGRYITLEDFTNAPINNVIRWAFERGRIQALKR